MSRLRFGKKLHSIRYISFEPDCCIVSRFLASKPCGRWVLDVVYRARCTIVRLTVIDEEFFDNPMWTCTSWLGVCETHL